MRNNDQPAASSGGRRNAPSSDSLATDSLAADLPKKPRVHELAKLLGLTSKDVLAALNEIGSPAKSAASSIDRDTALRVAAVLLPDPTEPGGDSAEEIEEGALVAPLAPVFAPPQPLFLAPQLGKVAPPPVAAPADEIDDDTDDGVDEVDDEHDADDRDVDEIDDAEDGGGSRRRRRRGRRGRGRGRLGADDDDTDSDATGDAGDNGDTATAEDDDSEDDSDDADADGAEDTDDAGGTRRRRRRRRRKSADDGEAAREDDPPNTVVHVREARPPRSTADRPDRSDGDDGVQGVRGSTRLEAKRQRRRDGREAGRRRPPILSEAEFLARRESVDRVMVVREHGKSGQGHGLVQIGVLEDGSLSEHFVTSAGTGSLVGNVYLGRVQNVLPSMEAAFVDIGRGRNAVLYAGEVDWDAAGLEGKARKIEQALSTGDSVLVQVTKDPVGHKGARLTTQISLPGRFLVYVPGGGATGISRKLPDNERKRLKDILRRIVPDDAGVIIRTASEGVAEESLARDVRRLQAQWEVIKTRSEVPKAPAPQLLYEEPDLLIKVVRDLFTEDFSALVVQGRDALDTIEAYVEHVAPELAPRLRRHVSNTDVFTEYRIDEQLLKALDRKVWLPSGGYLVIDRTEAMTVIDVNTGKFTGSGGNLEETVTRNNLEAAEEVVRQLRLRDIGGIIVIDFIDMVLEANRDLVLRRLTECLGRDRTRHQVAEVTSLGLVQMTRKRVGSGLLEAFSSPCEHCRGRGVVVSTEPVEAKSAPGAEPRGGGGGEQAGRRGQRSRGKANEPAHAEPAKTAEPVKAEPAVEPVVEPAAVAEPVTAAEVVEPAAAESGTSADAVATAEPVRSTGRSRSRRSAAATSAAAVVDEPVAVEAPAPEAAVATDEAAVEDDAAQPKGRTRGGRAAKVVDDKPERTRTRRRSSRGQSAADEPAADAPDAGSAAASADTGSAGTTSGNTVNAGVTDGSGASGSGTAGGTNGGTTNGGSANTGGSGVTGKVGAVRTPAAPAQPESTNVNGAAQPAPASGPAEQATPDQPAAAARPRRRRAASRPAGPPAGADVSQAG